MSVEKAVELLERVESDEAFRRQMEETPTKEARYELAAEAGFAVSPEDVAAAAERLGTRELSEDELDGISAAGSHGVVLF
jgi:predicted ribosomally synthesized peptide with nif11-like leader